jgi:hypothetical protein
MLPGYLGRECSSGQGDSAPGKGGTEVAQERDKQWEKEEYRSLLATGAAEEHTDTSVDAQLLATECFGRRTVPACNTGPGPAPRR